MRSLGYLLLLAACSSDTSHGPDAGAPLTCDTSIEDYCAENTCDLTFVDALEDNALCPGTLIPCGRYNVVAKNGVDVTTSRYYQGGQLVAIVNRIFPGRYVCLAGPETLDDSACAGPSQTLPICGL